MVDARGWATASTTLLSLKSLWWWRRAVLVPIPPRAQLENRAFLVRDQSAKDHFGLGTASDRLGTDRHRSRQRTATIGVFGFATVQSVRNALAGIERASLSDERLAVRTPSCGSRRERFASRRVGEYVIGTSVSL